jgi:hypothetical protein
MGFEDLVGGPYSARTMVHRLSCAGLSLFYDNQISNLTMG